MAIVRRVGRKCSALFISLYGTEETDDASVAMSPEEESEEIKGKKKLKRTLEDAEETTEPPLLIAEFAFTLNAHG